MLLRQIRFAKPVGQLKYRKLKNPHNEANTFQKKPGLSGGLSFC